MAEMDKVPRKHIWGGVLILVVGFGMAGLAYLTEKFTQTNDNVQFEEQTGNLNLNMLPSLPPEPEATAETGITQTYPQTAQVIWPQDTTLDKTEKSQLQERVVAPIVDYYKENPDTPVTTVVITVNTAADAVKYPFIGQVVFLSGPAKQIKVVQAKDGVSWWKPDCVECRFSPSFSKKYPEIIKQF